MKIIISLILFISLLFVTSCDESFSPYGKFEQKYSLNCIVQADTNLQIATVFKSYPLNSNTTVQNKNNSFVHNAFIRIWQGNDHVVILKDTTENSDTSNGGLLKNYYFTKKLHPKANDSLEIDVILPNGIRLKSKTKVPAKVLTDYDITTKLIPPKNGNVVTFAWKSLDPGEVYIPTLRLFYQKNVGGQLISKKTVIPWKYIQRNGKEVGINKPPSSVPLVNFSMDNVEKVLKSISKGDNHKENYLIMSLVLELKVLDRNLSNYYYTTGRLFNDYTVKLDVQDLTNIHGGFGIFGSLNKQEIAILFDEAYLTIFGYRSAF